jgi:Uma2 family endonuclease
MSPTASAIKPISSNRLLTIADLAVLPSQLPTGPVQYELDHGRLLIMAPPGNEHGAVESNLVTELKIQGDRHGFGKVRSGDVGIVLGRNPDHVVGADIVFVCTTSLPIRVTKEGYLETIPDLIVEVRSKNDTTREINDKVKDYLDAGVRVVWVPDSKDRTLTVFQKGQAPQVLREDDMLTAEDVIPDFQLRVSESFLL